jgi:hypothetical protein
MGTRTRTTVLSQLPNELAFLKPCVREMRKLRVGFRPSVDPEEHPEEARDQEIDRFIARDCNVLGRHLRTAVPADSRDKFDEDVRQRWFTLLRWLKPHNKRYDDPEVAMLHLIVGYLGNPYPYYKPAKKKPRPTVKRRPAVKKRSHSGR